MAKNDNKDQNKKKGRYFKDMKAELKKVVWPSAKQTTNNTMAVIVFALVLAIIVFVLDVCFDAINKHAVTPLQEKITSSFNTTADEETSSEESEEENSEEESATDVTVEATSESDENNTNQAAETNTQSKENTTNTESKE